MKPGCAEETAEVVRFAAREKLAIIACGGRSKLGMGMPPARYDIALDMTRLQSIDHYDPADLTLSVDAGMQLSQLHEILGEQKQFVPLAVPFFETATIGGTVACGMDSAIRHGYGAVRDFLLGAEFVSGLGTSTKSGGRVVKNVTGYDLHKLLIGSLGTLAVITRLNFRTFPVARGSAHLVASFSSIAAVTRFQSLLQESYLTPASFDVLEPKMAARVGAAGKYSGAVEDWWDAEKWQACIGFEGEEIILQRYARELAAFAEAGGATGVRLVEMPASGKLGAMLREVLSGLRVQEENVTIIQVNVLPVLGADTARLLESTQKYSVECAMLARVSGAVYLALYADGQSEERMARLMNACTAISSFATEHQGYSSILFCPPELKRKMNVWGAGGPDLSLMRRLKKAFDPQNVLAPGRFIGGI